MRLLLLALLVAPALSACAQPIPFSVEVRNDGAEILFMRSFGTNPQVPLEIDRGDGPESVLLSTNCMLRCDQPAFFPLACADIAFIDQPFALLPGDSTTLSFDGALPVASERGCYWETNHHGSVSAQTCHAQEYTLFDGQPPEAPTVSGSVDTFEFDSLVDPICTSTSFDLQETGVFVLSIP